MPCSTDERDLLAEFSGVAKGTRVLTPNPLSKDGEGAQDSCSSCSRSDRRITDAYFVESIIRTPSPYLGKGEGEGEKALSTRVEFISPGNLVLTHRNRFMPVVKIIRNHHTGAMLEIHVDHCVTPLYVTPQLPVAVPHVPLPDFQARVSTARHLREHSTPSEEILWRHLRRDSLGVRFRRQHPLGPFILDFYAPAVRLALELDGSIHEEKTQRQYDQFRQECVETFGIEFVRLTNGEVIDDVGATVERIRTCVNSRIGFLDHRLLWVPAEKLHPGSSVLANGMSDVLTILSIKKSSGRQIVYDLEVADDNSYVTEACTVRTGTPRIVVSTTR